MMREGTQIRISNIPSRFTRLYFHVSAREPRDRYKLDLFLHCVSALLPQERPDLRHALIVSRLRPLDCRVVHLVDNYYQVSEDITTVHNPRWHEVGAWFQ